MPKDLGARRYSNGGPKSKKVRSFSGTRNGRGPSICDDDANANVPESRHNSVVRRNTPARGYNKAGRRPQYSL